MMDERHKKELRDHHIKNQDEWDEFEQLFENFPVADHPGVKSRSCIMGTLLWTVAVIFLIAVCYLFFVLLQYALFNPIIFAVMLIVWIKMAKTF